MSLDGQVFLVSRRWPHHAAHSGYDVLARHVGTPLTVADRAARMLPEAVCDRLRRGMPGYDRASAALELVVARHMASRRDCLYHVLYGDNTYNQLSALVGWRGHQIVVSYHHPPAKLAVYAPKRIRGSPSAVIVLGRNQLPCFAGAMPPERLFVVPYAVDTEFFRPPGDDAGREPGTCLFVGAHLRDFDTLRSVIQDARFVAPGLRFLLVLHPAHAQEVKGVVGRFTVYSGLSDTELRRLYQTASLLVLPLSDAVANTTLLEAMACGLPAVVTDVGAVREYAGENEACLVPPHDPGAMLDAIRHLTTDSETRTAMGARARAKALRFAWPAVMGLFEQVYGRVRALPARQPCAMRGGEMAATAGGDGRA